MKTRSICRRRAPILLRMPICFDFWRTDTTRTDAIAKDEASRLHAEMIYAMAACARSEVRKLGGTHATRARASYGSSAMR